MNYRLTKKMLISVGICCLIAVQLFLISPMFTQCFAGGRFRFRNRRCSQCNACQQTQTATLCNANRKTAKKQDVVTSLFDGKTLGGWKKAAFGTSGDIKIKKGVIHLGFSNGCTGITWAKKYPKMSYEISLDAMRTDGNDFFCGLTFPVNESSCSLIVGGWGGGVVGLSSIDGRDASENSTTRYQEFESNRWYRIRLRVTPTKIEAWVDKKKIVDFVTIKHKLSIRPEVDLSKPLGIASWCTSAAVRNLQIRSVTKPDTPAEIDNSFPTD